MLVMALMAFVIIPGHADAQDVFAGLAGMNHVESTYISGRFSHNKKYWTSDTGEHTIDLRRGFSSFYSYKCSSEESVSKAEEILKSYLKKIRISKSWLRLKEAWRSMWFMRNSLTMGRKSPR